MRVLLELGPLMDVMVVQCIAVVMAATLQSEKNEVVAITLLTHPLHH